MNTTVTKKRLGRMTPQDFYGLCAGCRRQIWASDLVYFGPTQMRCTKCGPWSSEAWSQAELELKAGIQAKKKAAELTSPTACMP